MINIYRYVSTNSYHLCDNCYNEPCYNCFFQTQESGLVSCVLTTMEMFFRARTGATYIYSSLLLLIKMTETRTGAGMLCLSDLTSHLCLALTGCYSGREEVLHSHPLAVSDPHILYI